MPHEALLPPANPFESGSGIASQFGSTNDLRWSPFLPRFQALLERCADDVEY